MSPLPTTKSRKKFKAWEDEGGRTWRWMRLGKLSSKYQKVRFMLSIWAFGPLISSPIQLLDQLFRAFSKAALVGLKLNLSTGCKQHYFSLLRASQHSTYTTDATFIHWQPRTRRQLHLHIVPFRFMRDKNTLWFPPPVEIIYFRCVLFDRHTHWSSAASHLVDTGGSILPPAWGPGYPEGTWGRKVRSKSPGYGDIHTAGNRRRSTELNPKKEMKIYYVC